MGAEEASQSPWNRQVMTREQKAWYALETLGREQFVDFMRAVRDESHVIAVRLANDALDDGRTVDQLFFTSDKFGFQLDVTWRSQYEHAPGQEPPFRQSKVLEVDFGCLAGGLAGDGGRWVVALTADGAFDGVLEQKGGWIA